MIDDMLSDLKRHPWVADARWDATRNTIVVRPNAAAIAVRPEPGPLLAEHLAHWQHVYEFVYTAGELRHGDDLDLSGWRASDTGAPFPREHMIEWIDHAVDLVLRDKPGVVLEVGCGSGLLVHRIRHQVRSYLGLDVAEPAVDRLRAQRLPGVRVLRASAHELASAPVTDSLRTMADATASPHRVTPDCIVLNSVTQCFPNERYLTAVLDDALDLVSPGGTVVVGDNRNLANAPDYARWLESARHPGIPAEELTTQAASRLAADEELLCDPRVFARIARRHRRDVRVACYAKPLGADTELTRYRYDVVFTVDSPPPGPCRIRAWADLPGTSVERLRTLATETAQSPTLITGIPNALLDGEAPDAVTPAQLAGAVPAGWAVLLDSADAHRLAVGPPEHHTGLEAVSDTGLTDRCNDPFTRFLRRRLPEVLTDHLEQHIPATPAPRIAVSEELTAP
ncbi:class I SAM-dependent methyltransferase [Nocardia sp. NPDC023852]|uniref:class I SAM-dependent methyltransferase n=1 Tax=Nocardia sp. NPDC023852 TaxID=3154697 RepID=UPI0034026488